MIEFKNFKNDCFALLNRICVTSRVFFKTIYKNVTKNRL